MLIYNRLKESGELDKLREIQPPHEWSRALRPRRVEAEPIDLKEKLAETKKAIESLGI